jgi:hypothetical protein
MLISLSLFCLLNEITASHHHGLNPLAETPAGLCHNIPGEGGHHLRDLDFQGVCIVVGGLLASISHSVHPGLYYLLWDLQILIGIDFRPLGKEFGEGGGHHVTLMSEHPRHHNSGGGAQSPVVLSARFLVL